MDQQMLFDRLDRKRIRKKIPNEPWAHGALKAQGDLIYSVVSGLMLTEHTRVDTDSIDRALVRMGHDLTRQQISAGAQNAVQRELLKKEGRDWYYVPKKKEVYK